MMTASRVVRLGFLGAGWWATANHMPLLAKMGLEGFDALNASQMEVSIAHCPVEFYPGLRIPARIPQRSLECGDSSPLLANGLQKSVRTKSGDESPHSKSDQLAAARAGSASACACLRGNNAIAAAPISAMPIRIIKPIW